MPGEQLGLYGREAQTSGATLSPCGRYRYALWRRWGDGRAVTWVMLNPSTADAAADDPTIRRCIGFARAWGAGGIHVVNLFAWRATDPDELTRAEDPIGSDNDRYLTTIPDSHLIIAAWGRLGKLQGRDRAVLELLTREHDVRCLRITPKSGMPEHPLYVPGSTLPKLFASKRGSPCR